MTIIDKIFEGPIPPTNINFLWLDTSGKKPILKGYKEGWVPVSSEDDIFWAEYGVTSFDDIKAASDAGKEVKMKYGDRSDIYTLDELYISPINNHHKASFLSHNAHTSDWRCAFYEIELSGYGDALTWSNKYKPLGRLDYIQLGNNEQLFPNYLGYVIIPLASNTEIDALFNSGGGGGSGSGS